MNRPESKDQEQFVNWDAARDRIAAAKAALESEASPEILERIWGQRAAQLAKPPVAEEEGYPVRRLESPLHESCRQSVDSTEQLLVCKLSRIRSVPKRQSQFVLRDLARD